MTKRPPILKFFIVCLRIIGVLTLSWWVPNRYLCRMGIHEIVSGMGTLYGYTPFYDRGDTVGFACLHCDYARESTYNVRDERAKMVKAKLSKFRDQS